MSADRALDSITDRHSDDPHVCIPVHQARASGIASTDFIWRDTDTLTVGFMGGDARLHELVMAIVAEFTTFCNMRFERIVNVTGADIRVSFIKGIGSWSHVGTSARHVAKDKATMNFGWLRPDMLPDDDIATALVLHEFGHTLGARHEHLHPLRTIPWNKEAVYDYFAKIDWTRNQVDRTYFNTLLPIQSQFSEFDPESVMIYPIHQEWTHGDYEVKWRTRLSDGDKAFLAELYPYNYDHHIHLPSIKAATPQPPPRAGTEAVADYVLQDIQARVDAGKQKYGTQLMTHNGRDALWDAYQEAIDLCMYLRQAILESGGAHE